MHNLPGQSPAGRQLPERRRGRFFVSFRKEIKNLPLSPYPVFVPCPFCQQILGRSSFPGWGRIVCAPISVLMTTRPG